MPHRKAADDPPAPPGWSRGDTLSIAVVCVAAVVARLVYLSCLQSSVFFDHLVVNAAQYEGWARHGYPAGEPFFQSPLYVIWLRAVFVLSSEHSWLLAARLWQILMGTATTALVYVATRWMAGRGAATLAGFLAGLAGMSVYFDLEILPTSLASLLLTTAICGHVTASTLAAGRARRHLWTLSALFLGLAVITRPNFLILVPFLALHRGWSLRENKRRRLLLAGWYLLVAALPISMVAVRNTTSGQGFVLLTTSVGDNLLLAHNPQADGFDPFPPADVTDSLQEYARLGMNMPQRSAAARSLAGQWMRQNPQATVALWWKKLAVFYNRADIPNNRSIRQQKQECAALRLPPLGWIGMGVLLPLALAGIATLRRRDLRFLFLSLLVSVPLSLMPFLVCARFRTPLIPALAMLAGVGAFGLVAAARRQARSRKRPASMIAACLAGIVIAWPDWYGVQSLEFPRLATNRARLYRTVAEEQRAAGNVAAATRWMDAVTATLQQAIQLYPEDATAHLWLADLHLEAQRLDEAGREYAKAAALDRRLAEAQVGLARVALRQKHIETALDHYEKALITGPTDTNLAVEYAEVLFRQGQKQKALEVLRRQQERPGLTPQERLGLERLLRQISGR